MLALIALYGINLDYQDSPGWKPVAGDSMKGWMGPYCDEGGACYAQKLGKEEEQCDSYCTYSVTPCAAGDTTWYGVYCSEIDGVQTVDALVLDQTDIVGIPTEIGTLTALTALKITDNCESPTLCPSSSPTEYMTLPTELGSMTSLRTLDLYNLALHRTVPTEIGNLSLSLTNRLRLDNNYLTGTIPSEVGSLELLKFGLRLDTNLLTSSIPTEINYLTALQKDLELQSNSLCGDDPFDASMLTIPPTYMTDNSIGTACTFPSFTPTLLPSYPYSVIYVGKAEIVARLTLTGVPTSSFQSEEAFNVIKRTLVRVSSVLSDTSEVTDMTARDGSVSAPSPTPRRCATSSSCGST